jgi:hypothetical protein
MVWQDLLDFRESGATPMELAACLLKVGKARARSKAAQCA